MALCLLTAFVPAHAATCPYANASEPFPSNWNWLLAGPQVDDFQNPDVMQLAPGWLEAAFEGSELFSINT
jgi:hypothetical protein